MGVRERIENIPKSEEDKCQYRGLVLENGMRVFLVHDDTADKSAACMDVAVGYMSDPKDLPGLAHFCEHMLFLGTEKYPSENHYIKYLSEHSGRSNAHTSCDHTDYYFDVAPDQLKTALDIFSQFFISPLFTESATDREVNAIDSENSKNLLSDMWRFSQLEKSMCKADHPYGMFGTGNKLTLVDRPKELGVNIKEELLKFHSKWYSSDIMCLSVIGRESLDELESMVSELFSSVKCGNVKAPIWPESPYGPEQMKKRVYVVPIKDTRSLSMKFPIPDLTAHYKSHPESCISHLIGHEGPGSILSVLRARGWCNGLVAGHRSEARGFASFSIRMDLTEEAMLHVDDIVTLVFQYINLLRKDGPYEEMYGEMRDINNMHFRFKDKEQPIGQVVQLAYCTRMYAMEHILKGPFMCEEWRPDLIAEILTRLTPENIRMFVVGQKFKPITDSKEGWYGTEYKVEDIPEETIEKWRNAGYCEELVLPPKNDFIPTDFTIFPPDHDIKPVPTIIEDTMLARVWHKQDDQFKMPKACIRIDLTSPFAYFDPYSCNKSVMFIQMFEDSLNEYGYAALLAGLSYKLTVTTNGLQLYIGGYNNKQQVLLTKIVEKMVNFELDPMRFAILKENYSRMLRNFEVEQPRFHAAYFMSVLMTEVVWTKEEMHAALESMTVEDVKDFIPVLLSNIHLEFLIHGNVTKEKALEMVGIVQDVLHKKMKLCPLLPKQLMKSRQIQLEDKCSYLFSIASSVHQSSCILLYLQCGSLNTENNMKLEIFSQILNEPCYNILRTKEQLGYMVSSSMRVSNTEQGVRVMVQSSRDPLYVEQRIEALLEHIGEYIRSMSDADFNCHREAVAIRRLLKPKKLREQTDRFWSEIQTQQYHFDRDNMEVAYLRTLKKEDVIAFYEEQIHHAAPQRRKLSVHVLPNAKATKEHQTEVVETSVDNTKDSEELLPVPIIEVPQTLIEGVLAFQRSHALCPYAKPFMNIPPPSMGAKSKL